MIKNFRNKIAQDIFDGVPSRLSRKIPSDLHDKIAKLFDQINAATKIETLRIPPSNHLERLKGDLKEYWSIRINKQWRIIFKWENGEAFNIEIVDYH